jgi:glucose-1-phosphate adenylyltransferase
MISKAQDVMVVIMGGGKGNRLYPLTKSRAKPAVNFGGKYRLIDIPITNCLQSQFNKIFILTQYNSFSLNRHIWQTYSRAFNREGFIDIIAAQQSHKGEDWFQGTADAVRQTMEYVLFHEPKYVLILSGDQVYSMDYYKLLLWHEVHDAQVTIAAHYTRPDEIQNMGIIKVSSSLRVLDFCEKPAEVGEVENFAVTPTTRTLGGDKLFLGSMGIYLFNTPVLVDALDNKEIDFGRGVIPLAAKKYKMLCYPFDGYWQDVGTIKAFYEANMAWREGRGIAEMFQDGNVIYTNSRQLPPTRINGTAITDSLIADGGNIARSSACAPASTPARSSRTPSSWAMITMSRTTSLRSAPIACLKRRSATRTP